MTVRVTEGLRGSVFKMVQTLLSHELRLSHQPEHNITQTHRSTSSLLVSGTSLLPVLDTHP